MEFALNVGKLLLKTDTRKERFAKIVTKRRGKTEKTNAKETKEKPQKSPFERKIKKINGVMKKGILICGYTSKRRVRWLIK